jgi:hypothetical protein
MYNPKDIIETIAANLRQTRNPFGIPNALVNRWWVDSDLPHTGDTLFFTGMMYQFIPLHRDLHPGAGKYEDSPWAEYLRYARYVPGVVSGLGLALVTPGREKTQIQPDPARHRPDPESLEGRLFLPPPTGPVQRCAAYDLGDQKGFVRHARWVAEKRLQSAGIKRLITVDPHTTYALKELYPKYTGVTLRCVSLL